ncbi:MAG: class I SAM-dependent methyltransferase [Anaerolineales bacterium]|nr:class I SAM-dependent methyltransferase [Anaerolineales bacterium]
MRESTYSFARYLAAKRSVDDRALNRQVWETLQARLAGRGEAAPLRVLEVGAGIGTMVERLLDWDLLRRAHCTALDQDAASLALAPQRLAAWAAAHGCRAERTAAGISLAGDDLHLEVALHPGELEAYLAGGEGAGGYNLLLAHAFLDLVDLETTLPPLLRQLAPGGLFYFTLNFDGLSVFAPPFDPRLDELIVALYHGAMDARRREGAPAGESRAGRRLFDAIAQAGGRLLEAGASDWVVFPRDGAYPGDEAYFLHFILHTVEMALQGHTDLQAGALRRWAATRHAEVRRGELVYLAHQLDFLGEARSITGKLKF